MDDMVTVGGDKWWDEVSRPPGLHEKAGTQLADGRRASRELMLELSADGQAGRSRLAWHTPGKEGCSVAGPGGR